MIRLATPPKCKNRLKKFTEKIAMAANVLIDTANSVDFSSRRKFLATIANVATNKLAMATN